jgi:TRAP-type C4-dicarboxylate transport system permease small subunit
VQRLEISISAVARWMICAATVAGIVLSVFVALAAVMRYAVGSPFSFTEEIVGLLFAAMVFLALPYCTLQGKQIEVTFVVERLPLTWQRVSTIAALVFTIAFCFIYGWFAYEFTEISFMLNARSDMGRILLWPWMALMPLACLLVAIAAVVRFRRGSGAGDEVPRL